MVNDENMIQAVWDKARGMPDQDIEQWRQDECGAWLKRGAYNNPESEYGWKILNIIPGSQDELKNLQPFHWKNDFDIENSKPQCHIKADRTDIAPTQIVSNPRNTDT